LTPSAAATPSATSVGTPQATTTRPAPKMTYAETSMPNFSFPPGADPALEAMLPSEVDGVRLVRWSIPGAHSGGGGDVCFFFCPGEPEYFALALHRTTLDGTVVAVAAPANQPSFPVTIYAFKVPDAGTEELAPAWVTGMYRAAADPVAGNLPTRNPSAKPTPTMEPLRTQQATIGGKNVTILRDSTMSSFDKRTLQYLYAHGDVLFMVDSPEVVVYSQADVQYVVNDPTSPPEAVVDSIAALP
jgi:hypothetical protein